MTNKTAKMMMKAIGATLAICSIASMAESCMMTSSSKCTKKMIKKAINKAEDIADTMMSFM